ncbi:MAG: hypothetical protein CMO59_05295 [Verrucomicrobiales bacterium]|nr:hypothetical protein [Verrucomicrobiales bacterium]|tara:strand:+ start:175 stop:390 length:216 start_codon:yes stop_codon:yes gene_type:complete
MVIRIVLAFVFAFIFFLRKRWQDKEAFKKAPHPANRPSLINDFFVCGIFLPIFFYMIITFIHIWFLKIFGS